ncbi:hypothetical protein [Nocardioides sp. KR10-350]|uniref:hypothetical protein n=1 Tax=Nocardioides cheoyonin TaxID=3156615 RepID=UPI0032B53061
MIRYFASRRGDERGAVAILVAVLAIVLFASAAISVDIAKQVDRKHLLKNQLDAAATAAAFYLDTGTNGLQQAVDKASTFFEQNGEGSLDADDVSFWCVVGRKLNGDGTPFSTPMVADYQIPSGGQTAGVCNPDATSSATQWKQSEYQNRVRAWDGATFSMTCNKTLCAIPCGLKDASDGSSPGTSAYNGLPITCNTIRVGADQDVPFSFAPVIGVDKGSTGAQVAVACKGPCGAISPNPMDVVVMADRTMSMIDGRTDYRSQLADGIKGMLQVMTPEQQYVAFGALGPSALKRTESPESKSCTSGDKGLIYPSTSETVASGGSWVPIQFHDDYSTMNSNGARTLDTNNALYKAISCLSQANPGTHTALAASLKSAARYLLNKPGEDNNVSALGGANRAGLPRKVLIFETDGQPWEPQTSSSASALSLDNSTDVFSNDTDHTDQTTQQSTSPYTATGLPDGVNPQQHPSKYNNYKYTYNQTGTETDQTTSTTWYGGEQACDNFKQIADLAKAAGVLLITIGYNLDGKYCADYNNGGSLPHTTSNTTYSGTPYISAITPTKCISGGSGTAADPYQQNTKCSANATITYTADRTVTTTTNVNREPDESVAQVLGAAASGPDGAGSGSAAADACDGTNRNVENGDGDFFFCAAQGDDLAPIFITALSQVTTGVKLMNLPVG